MSLGDEIWENTQSGEITLNISLFFSLLCWNKPSETVGWVGMSWGALQDIIISSSVCWLKMNWNLSYTASESSSGEKWFQISQQQQLRHHDRRHISLTTTMTHLHIIWIRDVREGYKKRSLISEWRWWWWWGYVGSIFCNKFPSQVFSLCTLCAADDIRYFSFQGSERSIVVRELKAAASQLLTHKFHISHMNNILKWFEREMLAQICIWCLIYQKNI